MASLKLAAAALAVIVLVCASATTATAKRPYHYQPAPVHEDCKTQAEYFKNCLRLGFHKKCCGTPKSKSNIVKNSECLCEVEREAEIECAHERRCVGLPGKVKIAEMDLPCLENLKCKRA